MCIYISVIAKTCSESVFQLDLSSEYRHGLILLFSPISALQKNARTPSVQLHKALDYLHALHQDRVEVGDLREAAKTLHKALDIVDQLTDM